MGTFAPVTLLVHNPCQWAVEAEVEVLAQADRGGEREYGGGKFSEAYDDADEDEGDVMWSGMPR